MVSINFRANCRKFGTLKIQILLDIIDLLQKSENTLKPSASIGVASARYLRLLYDSKIFARGLIKPPPSTDIYYQVKYQITDYYVLRWLRALGSKVEVLLPWDLRQEMLLESQNTWNLYK
jgi:hypothetical protein